MSRKIQTVAGVFICGAALLQMLYCLPSRSERSMKLPDGRILSFDGIAIGTNCYYYDGKLSLALRRMLSSKWLEMLRLGPQPDLDLFNSQHRALMAGISQPSQDFFEISFSWVGTEPESLNIPQGNRLIQMTDQNQSFISNGVIYQSGHNRGYFNVTFTFINKPPMSDVLHLRLILDQKGTNAWVELGEMRVRNPIPKNKRQ